MKEFWKTIYISRIRVDYGFRFQDIQRIYYPVRVEFPYLFGSWVGRWFRIQNIDLFNNERLCKIGMVPIPYLRIYVYERTQYPLLFKSDYRKTQDVIMFIIPSEKDEKLHS